MNGSDSSKTAPKGKGSRVKVAPSADRKPSTKRGGRRKKSAVDIAIATELAPAAAIALLDKTEQASGSPAPALDALAAGVSRAEDDSKIRVQLMFDGGEVLPVEMSVQAGEALATGLAKELGPKSKGADAAV